MRWTNSMIILPGYQITEKVQETVNTVIWRGYREPDKKPVIIKTSLTEHPSSKEVARLKHEYEITRAIEVEGVFKPQGLEICAHRLVLIFEDIGGESLDKFICSPPVQLSDFFSIAVHLIEILGDIHKSKVIHKDIKPQNILIIPETYKVKINDFSIASRLDREYQTVSQIGLLEGTLAYMSPEQTGRMNRAIDYRTDFYSLGVTFYEMLCGELPFNAIDPMELVHCHIAKKPVSPCKKRKQKIESRINQAEIGEIPQVVSDLVMKLLAKTAEDRYQSAFGLAWDLENCLAQLQTTGEISHITLGEQDQLSHLQISQKLYGREAEVNLLLSTFDRIKRGNTEIVLISGCAGLGKSCLAYELFKPIVQENGYFIDSKFEQFKRDIPYGFLLQAFQELLRQILTETATQLQVWREKILNALGCHCQVIIDVIPEVELIVGPQPPVPDLGANESQNRFNLVFQKFIRVFTQKKHPL